MAKITNIGRIGFVTKGAYDDSVTYNKLDVVYVDDYGSFVSTIDGNKGNNPIEDEESWQPIASGKYAKEMGDYAKNMGDEAKEVATAITPRVVALEDGKANKDGFYEGMGVGVANNLASKGNPTEERFVSRIAGGEGKSIENGIAVYKEIKGESVVWNQLNEVCYPASTSGYSALSATLSMEDGAIKVVQSEASRYAIKRTDPSTRGHKVLLIAEVKTDIANDVRLSYWGGNTTTVAKGNNTWEMITFVISSNSNDNANNYPAIGTISAVGTFYVRYFGYIDLTKMFNGNTAILDAITDYESFLKYAPIVANSYAYNAGTIINNTTEAIKTTGVNLWDEQWEVGSINEQGQNDDAVQRVRSKNYVPVPKGASIYFRANVYSSNTIHVCYYDDNKTYITGAAALANSILQNIPTGTVYMRFNMNAVYGTTYHNDICINISNPSINGQYFPYEEHTINVKPHAIVGGLKSAGNVYDSKFADHEVQRVGVLDLGSLEGWIRTTREDLTYFSSPNIAGLKIGSSIISNKYNQYIGSLFDITNKSIRVSPADVIIVIRDDDIQASDIVNGKIAKLNGAIMYYELATPIVHEYKQADNMDIQVYNGGMEMIESTENTTPVVADVVYGIDYVATIDRLHDEIGALEGAVTNASTALEENMRDMQAWQILMANMWNVSPSKVGVVDIGSLNWVVNNAYSFRSILRGRPNRICKGNCVVYSVVGQYVDPSANRDVIILSGDTNVYFAPTTTYASLDAFKAAMKGIYLFYEKA